MSGGLAVKVEVLSLAGCSGTPPTISLIQSVASGLGIPITLEQTVITSVDEAVENRFPGSPTVRINGLDVETAARSIDQFAMT